MAGTPRGEGDSGTGAVLDVLGSMGSGIGVWQVLLVRVLYLMSWGLWGLALVWQEPPGEGESGTGASTW